MIEFFDDGSVNGIYKKKEITNGEKEAEKRDEDSILDGDIKESKAHQDRDEV